MCLPERHLWCCRGFSGLVVELGLRRSACLLSRLRGGGVWLSPAWWAGYDTRSLVAMIMLLQMLKVVRVVKAPAVRCDDALNATPVPAKIQTVEEVGAKKCV